LRLRVLFALTHSLAVAFDSDHASADQLIEVSRRKRPFDRSRGLTSRGHRPERLLAVTAADAARECVDLRRLGARDVDQAVVVAPSGPRCGHDALG